MNAYDDIIVAVHGIGSQRRNTTIRSVATQFARSTALSVQDCWPLSPQALGYFHTDVRGAVKVSPLDKFGNNGHSLARLGFSEVFWADIPQEVVTEKATLEETKAWARSVVARCHIAFSRGRQKKAKQMERGEIPKEKLPREPDFGQVGETLEEIIDTVQVLENLCFLAEKAGVLKIDIRQVLEDYVGDVQLVTEFTQYRREIIGRFHCALEQIHKEHPNARLHIVAHSEGSVISFLGLLHALSCERLIPGHDSTAVVLEPTKVPPDWVKHVSGYMTIGSPIDKHILLWPSLFENFDLSRAEGALEKNSIQWRNYYDLGDPVGFELDTARRWLSQHSFNPFNFKSDKDNVRHGVNGKEGKVADATISKKGENHDIGFARYMMPGKAHNDYWEDPAVFEHFVRDVVRPNRDYPPQLPTNRTRAAYLSPLIPYLISGVVLLLGVFLFYKSVTNYLNPPLDPLQNYVRYMAFGTTPQNGNTWLHLLRNCTAVAALVVGTTLMSRLPRLIRTWTWFWLGLLAFGIGAFLYRIGIGAPAGSAIGAFSSLLPNFAGPVDATILVAFVVGVIGLISLPKSGWIEKTLATLGISSRKPLPTRAKVRRESRRARYFLRGMRPLITAGALALCLLIGFQIWQKKNSPSRLTQAERDTAMRAYLKTTDLASVATTSPEWQAALNHLKETERLIEVHPPLWPVVLSGLAFLYLWWLSALIFDLAFVWQKYVRSTSTVKAFTRWMSLPETPSTGRG
jgi:hypothetical protein